MYLKLQKQCGALKEKDKWIPAYTWLYIGEVNRVSCHKIMRNEIENPDYYFDEYLSLHPKFCKGKDKTTVTQIMCFDWNKNFRYIGTVLEAYLLNNDGKTIEKLSWNQGHLQVPIKIKK